jgi:hypothetical protein
MSRNWERRENSGGRLSSLIPSSNEIAVPYPKMVRIRQEFERPRIEDVSAAIRSQLTSLDLGRWIKPGQTVALTAGSRGIANIVLSLRTVCEHLKNLGARPFIVPAMGSHGGATAEGQSRLLESYGIKEETVGVPIKSSMDTVELGKTADGFPVYLDRQTACADHIGVIARVKPHTNYHGPIESGLLKMMMIGLGKHRGALAGHRILLEYPFDQVVRSVTRFMRSRAPIRFGLGLVENAYDETALVEAMLPEDFEQREEAMLVLARKWLARLPLGKADLVIVDEIGKDISGSGMDTNVVGRKHAWRSRATFKVPALTELRSSKLQDRGPEIFRIFVRGLSELTHGNAAGIGLADFTTSRLIKAMDYQATIINCLTAGYPDGASLPVHFDSDRQAIDAALAIIGVRGPGEARILHIRNTLALEEMEVSEPCLDDSSRVTTFQTLGTAFEMAFDVKGNLA